MIVQIARLHRSRFNSAVCDCCRLGEDTVRYTAEVCVSRDKGWSIRCQYRQLIHYANVIPLFSHRLAHSALIRRAELLRRHHITDRQ
jgi:hypothetical protein